ncbi:MAG: thioredoxin [Bacteroidales bacterium]|nr:thioredoxin [Bacteroidales bacterium]
MAGLFSVNSYSFTDEDNIENIEEANVKSVDVDFPDEKVSDKKAGPVSLTDKDFEATISKGVTLVDFWATWCGPCRRQGPIIEEIASEYGDKAVIAKLDVDKNRKTAAQYHVRSIPTIIVFKDGKVVERLVGMQSKLTLVDVVNRYL